MGGGGEEETVRMSLEDQVCRTYFGLSVLKAGVGLVAGTGRLLALAGGVNLGVIGSITGLVGDGGLTVDSVAGLLEGGGLTVDGSVAGLLAEGGLRVVSTAQIRQLGGSVA